MASVRDYKSVARAGNVVTFTQRVGSPVLVQIAGPRPDGGDTDAQRFSTQVTINYTELLAIAQGRKLDPTAPVYSVVKHQGRNPFAEMIAIGRADNCDVTVASGEVSKFHAYLTRDPTDPHRYVVADANSSNGTFLNDQRLPEGQAVPVNAGDKIRLGAHLVLQFFPPPDFWSELNKD